jgi:hypothetical protein
MDKRKKNNPVSSEDIKKYLSGKALSNEKHIIEKKLLNDAFATDAMDGFEALKADKIEEKIIINDLKQRLEKRTKTASKKQNQTKIIPLWQTISVAASVVFVLGISIYFFIKKSDNQVVAERKILNKNTKLSKTETPTEFKEEVVTIVEQPKTIKKTPKNSASNILFEEEAPPAQAELEPVIISKNEERKIAHSPVPTPTINSDDFARAAAKPSATMQKKEEITVFSGQVLDEEDKPLAGVAVIQKSTNKQTLTDINGSFYLNNLKEGETLELNSIGYNSKEIIVKNGSLGKIKLAEDTSALSEVVVTTKSRGRKEDLSIIKELNQEPIPEAGWENYDEYLINSLKKSGSVSTLNFDEPLRLRLTVESNGKPSNIQIDNNLSKEQVAKVAEAIENGPKWLPARKKGKKIKKEVFRELRLK